MGAGPLNYSTQIDATRTVAEMQAALAGAGASAIGTTYDGGQPTGLTFTLPTPHGPRHYSLPVNVSGVERLLSRAADRGAHGKAKMSLQRFRSRQHAANVAWRVAREWLLAQLAMVEAAQVPIEEIMLPYLQVNETQTLREAYRERESALAIEAAPA
jgi:hypothetical protein